MSDRLLREACEALGLDQTSVSSLTILCTTWDAALVQVTSEITNFGSALKKFNVQQYDLVLHQEQEDSTADDQVGAVFEADRSWKTVLHGRRLGIDLCKAFGIDESKTRRLELVCSRGGGILFVDHIVPVEDGTDLASVTKRYRIVPDEEET